MKLKALSASVALAVGMGLGGTAAAGPTFFGGAGTGFEDDLLDFHIDRNGNGLIDAGDSIIAIISVQSTHAVNPAGGSVSITPPEFVGILDQFVLTKIATANPLLFNFVFGANPGGFLANTVPFSPGLVIPAAATAGAPAGTLVRVWDGPIADMDLAGADCNTAVGGQQTTLSACLTGASNGTLFWNGVFTGPAGTPAGNEHLIVSGASDNPALVLLAGASIAVGIPDFAFQQGAGGIGPDVLPEICNSFTCPVPFSPTLLVDYRGSGTVQGGDGLPRTGAGNTYVKGTDPFARGDFQFDVLTVPEPGSLALLGLGLAGLGAAARRRKSSK